jgi:hypothetical protein
MYNILSLHKRKNSILTNTIGFICKIVNKSKSQPLVYCGLIASSLYYLILIFNLLFFDVFLSIFLKKDKDRLQISLNCSNCVSKCVVVCILNWHHLDFLLLLHHICFVLFCFLKYFRSCYVCPVLFLQIYVANQLITELEQLFANFLAYQSILKQN